MVPLFWKIVNNAWFVGILTGLIVTWASRFLLTKKDDREYLQKVLGANREVIYAIRPGISEGQIPTRTVVIALLQATARRYGVSADALLTPEQIAEELIKEVMDSSFISAAQKAEFCAQLESLQEDRQSPGPSSDGEVTQVTLRRLEKRSEAVGLFSVLAGVMTASMTLTLSMISRHRVDLQVAPVIDKRYWTLIPALVAMLTSVIASGTMLVWRQLRRARQEQDRKGVLPDSAPRSTDRDLD